MKKIVIALFFLSTLATRAQDLAAIENYIEQTRKVWDIPGLAVGIVKDGKPILAKGFGVKSVKGKDPVDANTLFAIASNTKAFISTAMAVLVQEGQIGWEDPVRKYLPEFELYDSYVSQETTIKDLLCHRVGLGTFSGDMMWYKSDLDVPELLSKLKHVPQAYSFRAGYGYSNLMFITAGEVIKRVTNLEWHEFVKARFFEPLEMTRSITSTERLSSTGNFAMPHKPYESGTKEIPWTNWDNMGAAGGVISSVNDMNRWMIFQLNNGVSNGDTLLTSEQQNITWTFHNNRILPDKAKEAVPGIHFDGYGLGWGISDYHGRMVVTHSGGYDGMYSRVLMVPDEKLGIVILTNSMKNNGYPLAMYLINQFMKADGRDWVRHFLELSASNKNSVKDRIEKIRSSQAKKTKPSLELNAYAGTFFSGMHGNIYLSVNEDKMILEWEDSPRLNATLTHWHNDTWQIHWDEEHAWFDFGLVTFSLNPSLEVIGMSFDVPNYDIFFDEVDLVKTK